MKFGLPYAIALLRQLAAGLDHDLGLVQYGTLSHEESMASLRTFAEKVMPRFA